MKRKEYQTTGTEPMYDRYYDMFRMESPILQGHNTMTVNISDIRGCTAELLQLVGGADEKPDYYYDPEAYTYKLALLPSLKMEEKIAYLGWKEFQQKRINTGHRPVEDKLSNWPKPLKEKLLKVQARIDVVQEEVAALQKRIERLSEAQVKDKVFLSYGPVGASHLNAEGVICEVDGQTVSIVNGLPTINEPTSPYHGMETADYLDVLVPKFRQDRLAKALTAFEKRKAEAIRNGLPVPVSPDRAIGEKINQSELPPWPNGVKPNTIIHDNK